MGPQISGFVVAKKAASLRKKKIEKQFFKIICADMVFKTVCGNVFKINGSQGI